MGLKIRPTGMYEHKTVENSGKVLAHHVVRLVFEPVTVQAELAARVGAEMEVAQSISFQKISNKCWVNYPCNPDADSVARAQDTAFELCERTLERRASKMAELMRGLVAIKNAEEGR